MVGGEKPLRIVDRETDGGQRREAGDDVYCVIPGVGGQSAAADLFPKAEFHAAQSALDAYRTDQRPDGIGSRRLMDIADAQQCVTRDRCAGPEQHQTDQQARERLGAAMAIGVIAVRRYGGERQSQKNEAGSQDIARRLQSVGYDRSRTGHQARDNLHHGEAAAHDHAAERDLLADEHPFSLASRNWLAASLHSSPR